MEGDSSGISDKDDTRLGHPVRRVVKFGYTHFSTCGDKWLANCGKCSKRVQDKIGVTRAFTK